MTSKRVSPKDFVNLLLDLQHKQHAQHESVAGASLEPQLALLRQWQSERLQKTYADLLASDNFRPACEFFLSDIYAARDFSQRDHDAKKLYDTLSRYLPATALVLLADTIRVNQLTDQLDRQLLSVLVNELGITDRITSETYVQAYRLCDNYRERKYQIDLLSDILSEVGAAAHNPLIGVAARLAHGPAQRAGWGQLYDFLERGYSALRHMKNIKYFVHTIEQRERRILERIFADHPDPFSIN